MLSPCRLASASSVGSKMARTITTDCRTGPFNWVDGRRCEPIDASANMDNIEPRSGQVLAKIPISGAKEIDR